MKLIDAWEDTGSLYFEIQVSPDRYVTVKKPELEEDYMYVLQNPDGTYLYDYDGNTYQSDEYPIEAVRFICRMEDNLILNGIRTA